MAHREQGDFVVEVDEAFDDDAPRPGAAARLCVVPRPLHIGRGPEGALALARAGHHRLDHAGHANGGHRCLKRVMRVGKPIGRGGQAQGFRRQSADALTVHGESRGAGGGNHRKALGFECQQGFGVDGLDLRHDQIGLFGLDHLAQPRAVEHREHVAAVRHLHCGRVGVTVAGNHLHAQTLKLDDHLLAQFAAAEKQHARGRRGQRGTDGGHESALAIKRVGIVANSAAQPMSSFVTNAYTKRLAKAKRA